MPWRNPVALFLLAGSLPQVRTPGRGGGRWQVGKESKEPDLDHFQYRGGQLFCDELPAEALVARHGSPLYVYCARTIQHHYRVLREAFAGAEHAPLICYSVKACSNLSILSLLRDEGAGFDVVSGGELRRVLEVGGDPQGIVFAGVGKTRDEISAALAAGIELINV